MANKKNTKKQKHKKRNTKMQQGSGFVKQPYKEHPGGRVSQVGQTKCITMVKIMIIDHDSLKHDTNV